MIWLYSLTALALLVSFVKDKAKTKKAIVMGAKKLRKITPPFLTILMVISVVLYIIPNELIVQSFGEHNVVLGSLIASLFGAITMIPGPIVYPLCAILYEQGVTYGIIAAFSTSLMMVGVLTFPLEKAYYGTKLAVTRNVVSFGIALVIAAIFTLLGGLL